jgi:hypothetical protein
MGKKVIVTAINNTWGVYDDAGMMLEGDFEFEGDAIDWARDNDYDVVDTFLPDATTTPVPDFAQAAIAEVRKFFPNVDTVRVHTSSWEFRSADGAELDFSGKDIDYDILHELLNQSYKAYKLPVTFKLEN